jgi:hypothetical protein
VTIEEVRARAAGLAVGSDGWPSGGRWRGRGAASATGVRQGGERGW